MLRTLALAALVTLAGCVAPAAPADSLSASEGAGAAAEAPHPFGGWPDPLVVGHDHADVAAHALSTPTMEALAHLPLWGPPGMPGVAFGEMDLLGDGHLVVSGLLDGFFIVDVRDPAAPAPVSFALDAGFIADVKASESGDFVFVGVQLAGFTGVHAYNVADRERPFLAGAFPMQGGCHMLAVHRGHLYCAPNDATVRIFEIVEAAAAVALVPKGVYAPRGEPETPLTLREDGEHMTHDMTVQDDPLTGEAVMLVSFWDHGMRVVSVEDPARPVELGAWTGAGAEETYEGNVHTSMAGLVDGRRVVVTVPEYALAPSVTFLDATDYANMTVLGVWAPKPADAWADESRAFSTHNFQLVEGKVYLAMYHGGLFVLDAATREVLGYHLPAAEAASGLPVPAVAFLGGLTTPNVWDVVLKDGVILATDIGTGLHALRLEGDGNATSFA